MLDESETVRRSWRFAAGLLCTGVLSGLIGCSLVVAIDQIPPGVTEKKTAPTILLTRAATDRASSDQGSEDRQNWDAAKVRVKQQFADEKQAAIESSDPVKRTPARRWYLLGEFNNARLSVSEYWIEPGKLPVLIKDIQPSIDALGKPRLPEQDGT